MIDHGGANDGEPTEQNARDGEEFGERFDGSRVNSVSDGGGEGERG